MSWKGWWGIVYGLVQRNLNFYYDGIGKLIEGSSADGDDKTLCTGGCCECDEYIGLNIQHCCSPFRLLYGRIDGNMRSLSWDSWTSDLYSVLRSSEYEAGGYFTNCNVW